MTDEFLHYDGKELPDDELNAMEAASRRIDGF